MFALSLAAFTAAFLLIVLASISAMIVLAKSKDQRKLNADTLMSKKSGS